MGFGLHIYKAEGLFSLFFFWIGVSAHECSPYAFRLFLSFKICKQEFSMHALREFDSPTLTTLGPCIC
jgi:hypothetical protein